LNARLITVNKPIRRVDVLVVLIGNKGRPNKATESNSNSKHDTELNEMLHLSLSWFKNTRI
jgi:hypothetical protein